MRRVLHNRIELVRRRVAINTQLPVSDTEEVANYLGMDRTTISKIVSKTN